MRRREGGRFRIPETPTVSCGQAMRYTRTFGSLSVMKLSKRIAEAATRKYFLKLVRQSYLDPHSKGHGKIMAEAKRWYGLEPAGSSVSVLSRWFMEFVFEAQRDLFHSKTLPRLDLGEAPIGVDDLNMNCSSDDINSSIVYLLGFTDNLVFYDVYSSFTSWGSIAVDVGANLGIHSLMLSHCVGARGSVISFEPISFIYERLRANIDLNGLTNVIACRQGVGKEISTKYMRMDQDDFNIGKAHVSNQGDHAVAVTTLDHELKDIESKVSLIKIDTEGYELQAIKGARRILEEHRPALVCEFNPNSYSFDDLRTSIPRDFLYFRMPGNYYGRLKPVKGELKAICDLLIVPKEKWTLTVQDKLGRNYTRSV